MLVAMDFRKAYDSVRRETVLEIMKEIRMAAEVVEIFEKVHREDRTRIQMRNGDKLEMVVGRGIRQGCTASTVIGI